MNGLKPVVQISDSGHCDVYVLDPVTGDSQFAMGGPADEVLDFLTATVQVLTEKLHPDPTPYEDLF